MIALENSFYVNEEDFGDAFAKKTGFEDFRDSIGMDWQHTAKSPTKTKDKYKGVSDYFYNLKLERFTNESLHKETQRKVLMNVYRKEYGIPADLMVRKPDANMRAIVQNSDALNSVQKMYTSSIHPSLIMFENKLPEYMVMLAIKELHGDYLQDTEKKSKHDKFHSHQLDLMECNSMLMAAMP